MLRLTSQKPEMGAVSAERGKPARPEHLVCCWVGRTAAPVGGFPHEPSGLPKSAAGCLQVWAQQNFTSNCQQRTSAPPAKKLCQAMLGYET